MNDRPLRWGILGTADIARKNWKAIANAGNATLTAVASRDLERSRTFIARCQADAPFPNPPRALASYKELLASDQVDAVYIPLPTGLRKEWVLRAAESGKHVLCEKPCALSVEDLQTMIEACRRHQVQFMDGVMFMHSTRLVRIREVLQDPQSVGAIKRMSAQFCFLGAEDFFRSNIRMHSGLEPEGCLGDLGWYCLRFFLWAMNWRLPRKAFGRLLSARSGQNSPGTVPTSFSGELIFDGDVSAGFYCSFETELQQWAHVGGDKGSLHVADFVLPYFGSELAFTTHNPIFQVRGCDFNMEEHTRRHAVSEYGNSQANAQEAHMFRNFSRQALSGTLEPLWPEMALKTQQVMSACRISASQEGKPVLFE